MDFHTIAWIDGEVSILDQRRLPHDTVYLDCRRPEDVADAIRTLAIRGAPAIGVAAAMGIALGVSRFESDENQIKPYFEQLCDMLKRTRPTAVNLFWAVQRMRHCFFGVQGAGLEETRQALIQEALTILNEDVQINRALGQCGKDLIPDGAKIITHCNTGALATADYGTALGVIRSAFDSGKKLFVYIDETRPLLQGARLTAWECLQYGIPSALITDNMAGHMMKTDQIDLVILGADRIAANGDTANKIGTYSLAVLAKYHHVPFYVAAPISTIDKTISSGSEIPIEQRDSDEVRKALSFPIAPKEIDVRNPAFDVTPNELITAIITERKILYPPFVESISQVS